MSDPPALMLNCCSISSLPAPCAVEVTSRYLPTEYHALAVRLCTCIFTVPRYLISMRCRIKRADARLVHLLLLQQLLHLHRERLGFDLFFVVRHSTEAAASAPPAATRVNNNKTQRDGGARPLPLLPLPLLLLFLSHSLPSLPFPFRSRWLALAPPVS